MENQLRNSVPLLACMALLISAGGCVPEGNDGWYGPGRHAGGYGPAPGERRYTRGELWDNWVGASYGEVLDHWGEPYERAYWDYEDRGNQTIGWGPYMAYVEVVREPYAGRAGAVEHIYFILDQQFQYVERIEFSEEVPWWGGEVEVMLLEDDW